MPEELSRVFLAAQTEESEAGSARLRAHQCPPRQSACESAKLGSTCPARRLSLSAPVALVGAFAIHSILCHTLLGDAFPSALAGTQLSDQPSRCQVPLRTIFREPWKRPPVWSSPEFREPICPEITEGGMPVSQPPLQHPTLGRSDSSPSSAGASFTPHLLGVWLLEQPFCPTVCSHAQVRLDLLQNQAKAPPPLCWWRWFSPPYQGSEFRT